MAKQNPKQPGPPILSSKRKVVTQQSAPLATASSPPGKAKKPKAAESTASSPSLRPASTPEGVKQLKAKPVEVALTVVPPPPPAEVAKVTSPVAATESSKDSAAAINAVCVTGSAVNAVSVAAAAVENSEESSEEEGSGDE
jgi:hypothetical protein